MNFKIKPMKIEVEMNNPDVMLETWVESKNRFLEIDYDNKKVVNKENGQTWDLDEYRKEVFNMDLGFGYFQDAKFKIRSSIALRDLFYTFMEYQGKWAKTARYAMVDEFICSEEMYEEGKTEEAFAEFEKICKDYKDGKIDNFDKARQYMPISYQVEWMMNLPIKQFIKYVAAVYIHFHDTLPQLWEGLWTACMEVPELKKWMPRVLKYSKTEEVNKYVLTGNSVYDQDFFKANFKVFHVGMILYSHIIRHESTICLGYIDFLKGLKENKEIHNCRMTFDIGVYQSRVRESEMIRVRTSWFAITDDWEDPNSWGSILKKYFPEDAKIEDYKKFFKFFDEAGNFNRNALGQFNIDEALKVFKGYKANLPDPFLLEYRAIIKARAEKVGWNPLLKMYDQLFELGYVKDNPENPYRKKWIELNGEF